MRNVALQLVGRAVKAVAAPFLPEPAGVPDEPARENDFQPVVSWFGGEHTVDVSDDLADDDLYARLHVIDELEALAEKHLEPAGEAELAAAMEFLLEALHQNALISRQEVVRGRVYTDPFEEMVRNFNA